MTPETRAAYLALAAVIIGSTVRLLKSNAVDAVLARFGLPSIPKRALPWVALALGGAGGLVAGLEAGKTLGEALVLAAQGLVSGIGAIAGHELVVESARDGKEIPLTPPGPKGPAIVLVLAVSLWLPGCAIFKSPITKTVVDLAFAECVQRAESSDSATVAALCGAGPELYAILERLLAAKRAGMKAGACKPAPVSVRTPMLYNSALQICMGDLGYRDVYGITQ